MEQRLKIIYDSFYDLEKEMKEALQKQDLELIQYQLFRTYRLIARTNSLMETNIGQKNYSCLYDYFSCVKYMKNRCSFWYEEMANYFQKINNVDREEREWFASIIESDESDVRFIQYTHSTLKKHHLFINKEIKDNMENVSATNVQEIITCLRRVKLTINAAVNLHGSTEQSNYILGWVGEMEKSIELREDLQLALKEEPATVTLEKALADLDQLIGLTEVKRKVKEISNWVTFNEMRKNKGFRTEEVSLHMVFSGNPGTGKTTVARLIAAILKAIGVLSKGHLVEVGRSDLVAEYVGQTAIKTMKKINEAKGGILFIDEAYSLVRGQSGGDFGIEAIDTLVKAMEDERKDLVVILAGYPTEMKTFIESNPGLQSRFKNQINFLDYKLEELMEITDLILKQREYKITSEARSIFRKIVFKSITKNPLTHGNGRLIRNIVEDTTLAKASSVMEQKLQGLPYEELDLIDEAVMKMVEGQHKSQFQVGKVDGNVKSFPDR